MDFLQACIAVIPRLQGFNEAQRMPSKPAAGILSLTCSLIQKQLCGRSPRASVQASFKPLQNSHLANGQKNGWTSAMTFPKPTPTQTPAVESPEPQTPERHDGQSDSDLWRVLCCRQCSGASDDRHGERTIWSSAPRVCTDGSVSWADKNQEVPAMP